MPLAEPDVERVWWLISVLERAGLLEAALKADLTTALAGRGFFTRVVTARAAQYEILAQELRVLAVETRADRELGASTAPLSWQLDDSLMPAI